MSPKKKCYFVSVRDEGIGISVVATSSKEAKKIGWNSPEYDFSDDDFIDLRVKWMKKVDVSKYKVGDTIPFIDGLKIGAYSHSEGIDCPICSEDSYVVCEQGVVGCYDCLEKRGIPI